MVLDGKLTVGLFNLRKGARSEATSRTKLVIVVGGMREERSDELKGTREASAEKTSS